MNPAPLLRTLEVVGGRLAGRPGGDGVGLAFLVQIVEGVPSARFEVPGGEGMTMGRQADNQVVLKDSRVSRKHARVAAGAEGVTLSDLESVHLTYRNGEAVRTCLLKHGDRISVAQIFDFLFFDRDDPELLAQLLAGGASPEEDQTGYSSVLTQEMGNLFNQLRGDQLLDSQVARQLQTKMNKVLQELRSLYEIGNAISMETDLSKVLELVLVHVLKATKAERGFLMLLDDNGRLLPVAARSVQGELDENERKQFSTTLAKRAIETENTLVSKDTSTDPALATKSVVDYNIRSCICAPLRARSKMIGCLYVDAKESIKSFSEKDVDFFEALTGQAAVAIQNALLVKQLTASNRTLQRKVSELEAMFAVSQSLSFGQGQTEVLETVIDQTLKVVGAERGSVLLTDPEGETLQMAVARGRLDPGVGPATVLKVGEGIAGVVAQKGTPYIANQGAKDPAFVSRSPRDADIRNLMCAPLAGKDGILGVITTVNKKQGEFTGEDLQILSNLAHHAAASIEKSRLYNMAVFDGLTKLYVKRYFNAWMEREVGKALRYGNEISLLVSDIDHFKKFNDTYGHHIGDQVLVEVAQIFRESARGSDLVARYGGEEFVVALPETDLQGAEIFAERLRARVEAHRVKTPTQELKVTISLGICTIRNSGVRNPEEMFKAADSCLYQAKARGRNQWVSFKPALSSRELAEQVKRKITSAIPAVSQPGGGDPGTSPPAKLRDPGD